MLELFPDLIWKLGLQRIEYYALKSVYQPDSLLVVVPRLKGNSESSVYKGDLYRSELGVHAPDLPYDASFTDMGFRVNGGSPPFTLALLGDSYVEAGEEDAGTLSEQLRQVTGRSTYNLGRGWYGPFQYLEVFRRYALPLKPEVVLFCFFAGNDIDDIEQYQQWRSGGAYHFYDGQLSRSFLRRYLTALSDTREAMMNGLRPSRGPLGDSDPASRATYAVDSAGSQLHPELGIIRLGSRDVPMAFAYWQNDAPAEELLASEPWQTLRSLLSHFRQLSIENGIEPLLVYIPTRIEVYAPYAIAESGAGFSEKLASYAPYRASARMAFSALAADLHLGLIDLMPDFERRAAQGELLFHPFDTHWNRNGIRAAALAIGSFLETRASHRLRP